MVHVMSRALMQVTQRAPCSEHVYHQVCLSITDSTIRDLEAQTMAGYMQPYSAAVLGGLLSSSCCVVLLLFPMNAIPSDDGSVESRWLREANLACWHAVKGRWQADLRRLCGVCTAGPTLAQHTIRGLCRLLCAQSIQVPVLPTHRRQLGRVSSAA